MHDAIVPQRAMTQIEPHVALLIQLTLINVFCFHAIFAVVIVIVVPRVQYQFHRRTSSVL